MKKGTYKVTYTFNVVLMDDDPSFLECAREVLDHERDAYIGNKDWVAVSPSLIDVEAVSPGDVGL